MIGRFIGFVLSLIGLLLPHRLRIWYSSFLGWCTQALYFAYYGLLNFIIKELREAKAAQERERESS
jgi:hypothetical protein